MIESKTKYKGLMRIGVILLSAFLIFSSLGLRSYAASKSETVTKTFNSIEVAEEYAPKETITLHGDTYALKSHKVKKTKSEYEYTYKEENPFSFSADSEREFKQKNGKTVKGTLKETKEGDMYKLSISLPATFRGSAGSSYFIFGDSKVIWSLDSNRPVWETCEKDILNYLNLDSSIYGVTGGEWTGDSTSGTVRTRTAVFSGTKNVRDYTASYDVSGDPNYEVKVVSTYEKVEDEDTGLSLATKILIGVGALVIASAIATLIYLFSKRRKEEDDEE